MKRYFLNNSAVFLTGAILLAALALVMVLLVFQGRRVEIRNTNRIAEVRAFIDRRMEEPASRAEAADLVSRLASIGELLLPRGDVKSTSLEREGCDVLLEVLPVTIKNPGVYCLAKSIDNSAVELDAINIQSNDVLIDGRGRSIAGPASPETRTRGILAVDQHGLTIKNLRIEGFAVAILIGDTTAQVEGTTAFPSDRRARDILIDEVRTDNATFQGIHIRADNFTIQNSTISGIGPSRINPHSFATGILARGNICTISNNRVALGDATGNGENIGIALNLGSGCLIEDNIVYFDKYPVWGRNFGIWTKSEGGSLPVVSRNLVAGAHYAYGPHGIFVDNASENAVCNLFARRRSDVELLADVKGNVNFSSNGFVRPGSKECPDNPTTAITRFYASPAAEAAYAVALAFAEVSPIENEVDTLAWLLVAARFGHELAMPAADNPASAGYSEKTAQSARTMANEIMAKAPPPPG